MDVQHHLRRLLDIHVEETLEHHHDEFHRRVIVVEQQHLVHRGLFRLGAGARRDTNAGAAGRAVVLVRHGADIL